MKTFLITALLLNAAAALAADFGAADWGDTRDEVIAAAEPPAKEIAPPADADETYICLADKLNVRADPNVESDVVAAVEKGDSLFSGSRWRKRRWEGPPPYEYWLKVRTSEGAEGWVAKAFVCDEATYGTLAPAREAAERGDRRAVAAALAEAKEEHPGLASYASPDGAAYVVEITGKNYEVVLLTVGDGVVGTLPGGPLGEFKWSPDTSWCAYDAGTCAWGRSLYLFATASPAIVLHTGVIAHDFEFTPRGDALVWFGTLGFTAAERVDISREELRGSRLGFERDVYVEELPAVFVYDLGRRKTLLAAAPDASTLRKSVRESEPPRVTLTVRPEFASDPAYEGAAEAAVFREHAGKETAACTSEAP
jgi:hypothetical protein